MDTYTLAVVAAAFLLGGLVKGVVGMGLPTVSLAVLGSAFGLHEALPLLVVPAFLTNVWQALFGGQLRTIVRRFWPMLAASAVGVVPGTWILLAVSGSTMTAALGAVLCLYATLGLARFRLSARPPNERLAGPVIGLSSGVVAGATGTLIVPVGLYLEALKLDKDVFVQTIGLSFAVSSLAIGLALAGQRAFDLPTLMISSAAVVPAFLGMFAGQLVRDRLSAEAFRRWVLIALLGLGLHLIAKGAF